MKFGTVIPHLKNIQKCINHATHPFSSASISAFPPEISKFCYIRKYRQYLHFDIFFPILLNIIESLKVVLINMIEILMMSPKLSTSGLLEKVIF